MKATKSLLMVGTAHSSQHCHFPESLNSQRHHCENLKYRKIMFFQFTGRFLNIRVSLSYKPLYTLLRWICVRGETSDLQCLLKLIMWEVMVSNCFTSFCLMRSFWEMSWASRPSDYCSVILPSVYRKSASCQTIEYRLSHVNSLHQSIW